MGGGDGTSIAFDVHTFGTAGVAGVPEIPVRVVYRNRIILEIDTDLLESRHRLTLFHCVM